MISVSREVGEIDSLGWVNADWCGTSYRRLRSWTCSMPIMGYWGSPKRWRFRILTSTGYHDSWLRLVVANGRKLRHGILLPSHPASRRPTCNNNNVATTCA